MRVCTPEVRFRVRDPFGNEPHPTPRDVTPPEAVTEDALRWRYGADSLTLALDARADAAGVFHVATAGWRTLESATLNELLSRFAARGFAHFLVTDIDRDGMLAGPNVELYRDLRGLAPHAAWADR